MFVAYYDGDHRALTRACSNVRRDVGVRVTLRGRDRCRVAKILKVTKVEAVFVTSDAHDDNNDQGDDGQHAEDQSYNLCAGQSA